MGGPNGSFFTVSIKVMIRNVKDIKRVPCYQRNAEYAGAGAYKAIEKTTGETSSKGFAKTPQKSHEVASSM